jgi:hypothetical protein
MSIVNCAPGAGEQQTLPDISDAQLRKFATKISTYLEGILFKWIYF